jgi:hypothetical protein
MELIAIGPALTRNRKLERFTYALQKHLSPVDGFVAVKAHDFTRIQQISTSGPQELQQ